MVPVDDDGRVDVQYLGAQRADSERPCPASCSDIGANRVTRSPAIENSFEHHRPAVDRERSTRSSPPSPVMTDGPLPPDAVVMSGHSYQWADALVNHQRSGRPGTFGGQ